MPKNQFVVQKMDEYASKAPEKYRQYIEKAKPAIIAAADGIEKAAPHAKHGYAKAKEAYAKVEPMHLERYVIPAAGLGMCFYGANYMTLICVFEAVRLVAWDRASGSVKSVYRKAKEAFDKHGADDEEISRKLYASVAAVDPKEASETMLCLWTSFLACLAVVRVSLAGIVTLGWSLGEMEASVAEPHLEPRVKEILPSEFKKWSQKALSCACIVVSVVVAFVLQRVIGCFHTAIRGAQLAVAGVLKIAQQRGLVDFDAESKKGMIAVGVLALLGFYWQLSSEEGVPFPFNVLFLPVTIAEWMLQLCFAA